MAARTRKTELTDSWREKISASMLVNRLKDHVDGKNKLEPTQIKAAEILLARVAPTLSAVEQTNIDPEQTLTEQQLMDKLVALIDAHPDLVQRALAAKARKDAGATLGATDDAPSLKVANNQ